MDVSYDFSTYPWGRASCGCRDEHEYGIQRIPAWPCIQGGGLCRGEMVGRRGGQRSVGDTPNTYEILS